MSFPNAPYPCAFKLGYRNMYSYNFMNTFHLAKKKLSLCFIFGSLQGSFEAGPLQVDASVFFISNQKYGSVSTVESVGLEIHLQIEIRIGIEQFFFFFFLNLFWCVCRTFHHWSSLIYPGWNRYRGQKKDVHSVRIKKKLVKKKTMKKN